MYILEGCLFKGGRLIKKLLPCIYSAVVEAYKVISKVAIETGFPLSLLSKVVRVEGWLSEG